MTSKLWHSIQKRYDEASDEKSTKVIEELEDLVAEFYDDAGVSRPEGTEEAVVSYAVSG